MSGNFCPQCGQEAAGAANFCDGCGASFGEPIGQTQEIQAAATLNPRHSCESWHT